MSLQQTVLPSGTTVITYVGLTVPNDCMYGLLPHPQSAEASATQLHLAASPPNTQDASLPTARLLARVRLAMASTELQLAKAQALFAEEDRQRRRPVLPDMPGRPMDGVLKFVDKAADQVSDCVLISDAGHSFQHKLAERSCDGTDADTTVPWKWLSLRH